MKNLLAGFTAPLTITFLFLGCSDESVTQVKTETGSTALDTVPPAPVTGLHTASPTAGSIALVWIAPGDDGTAGTATGYHVRYSTSLITEENWDSATHVDNEPVPKPAGQLETFRILDLASLTDYFFALKTSDEVPNTSVLSNVATGTTKQENVPPAAVADLAVVALDDSTCRFTFTAPGDDYVGGTASEYDIRYSPSPITEQNWDSALQLNGEPPPKPIGQQEDFALTGFERAAIYFFALKTSDEVPNWSEISNVYAELEYGRSLWAWPTTIYFNSEETVLNVVYRVTEGEPISLVFDYFPLAVRQGMNDECGTVGPWKELEPVTSPTGTYMLTYDFAGEVSYGMNQYLILCHNMGFVDEINIKLLQ